LLSQCESDAGAAAGDEDRITLYVHFIMFIRKFRW
jgi:hypothetical protein